MWLILWLDILIVGLSSIAVCAPSDKFLNWGAPLGMGLGAVMVASLGKPYLTIYKFLVYLLHTYTLAGPPIRSIIILSIKAPCCLFEE